MPDVRRYARVKLPSGALAFARRSADSWEILDGAPWESGRPAGQSVPAAGARLACPVTPSKILGIGKNYRAHAAEMGGDVPEEPLVFSKLPTSLLEPEGTVLLPPESARVDYEGELGVVIGKVARRVPVASALEYVFGYTALCDVTARDLQARDGQWTRAKSFDTFCPVGPTIVTGVDPRALGVRLLVNGALRQDGNTRDMVFDVARLVAHASAFCTLLPGDLIATGTPDGIGPLSDGDSVEVAIDSLDVLSFRVSREP